MQIAWIKFDKMRKGSNIFNIDLSKLISGVYVYSIIVDGISVKSEKFNVVR